MHASVQRTKNLNARHGPIMRRHDRRRAPRPPLIPPNTSQVNVRACNCTTCTMYADLFDDGFHIKLLRMQASISLFIRITRFLLDKCNKITSTSKLVHEDWSLYTHYQSKGPFYGIPYCYWNVKANDGRPRIGKR